MRITSGQFSGWWVAAKSARPSALRRFSAPAQIQLDRGLQVGVRFFADGAVRTRTPVDLARAGTFLASRRATFAGRTFYFMSSGPLAGRWVSTLRATYQGVPPTTTSVPEPEPSSAPAATWKALVLVYRETNLTFERADGTNYHLRARMDGSMHNLVLDTLSRFRRSVRGWSSGLAAMEMNVVDVPHPLTSLDEFGAGYSVGPRSTAADIDEYAPPGRYDSVFVIWQAKDDAGEMVPVGGWGLSLPPGSWANGAGYSSIITPTWEWWWTDSSAPEEVFVHEWMHQVIFFHENAGRMKLDLHAGSAYGYKQSNGTWKGWLSDVMQGKVRDGDRSVGVSRDTWAAGTPIHP